MDDALAPLNQRCDGDDDDDDDDDERKHCKFYFHFLNTLDLKKINEFQTHIISYRTF